MKKSFTLIELLVVIAIIAILSALLLPALQKSRAKAQAIICINNQKNIGIASGLYMDDFEGFLPGANNGGLVWPGGIKVYPFIWAMHLYLNQPFVSNKGVRVFPPGNPLACPADDLRNSHYGNRFHVYSYGTNTYTNWMSKFNYPMRQPINFRKPSQYMYVVDMIADPYTASLYFGVNSYIINANASLGSNNAQIDFRHPNQTLNALFTDFHVEPMSYKQLYGSGAKYIHSDRP